MLVLLVWRLLKFAALAGLAGATAGAFLPEQLSTRQWSVYGLATASLALTWIAGFGLLRIAGHSMGAPWVAGSIVLSVAWFHTVAWAVETDDRRTPVWGSIATALLLLALALMVFRPG